VSQRYAVVQNELEPLDLEKLKRAFRGVPGLAPYDAGAVCNESDGILCRGFSAEQATALQANLRAEGVAAEIVDESQLPVLPPPRLIRRVEIKPEALFIDDLVKAPIPVPWERIRLIAAGSVQLTKFTRQETITEEVRFSHGHGFIPVPRKELKVEYRSKEKEDWYLRAEILLDDQSVCYSIEAERFHFASLGEGVTKDLAGNFCLLIRSLVAHAPKALLSRGAAAIASDPCQFVYYPRKNSFHEEILWMLWKAEGTRG
jgi:hypothetical protein